MNPMRDDDESEGMQKGGKGMTPVAKACPQPRLDYTFLSYEIT